MSLSLTLALAATGCQAPGPDLTDATPAAPGADAVNALADRYVAEYFDHFPDAATVEGLPGADHARLEDNTEAGRAAWQAVEDELLTDLRAIDAASLDAAAWVTHAFLLEQLEASVGVRGCETDLWRVSPTWTGWQSGLAFVASIQPVGTAEERAAAVARARASAVYIDREIGNLALGLERGLSAPQNNVQRVIEQMDGLLAPAVEDSPFYDPARRAEDEAFAAEMAAAVGEAIVPAIQRYRDFLAGTYLDSAREAIAVAANRDGAACYQASLRYHTSLAITPQEVHDTGLAQMAIIVEQMREIGQRFGTEDVAELLRRATTDPAYTFRTREEMVEYARAAVGRAQVAAPEWFGILPEAEVVIVPYPAFRERSAPGAEYQSASDDGSRPGTYYINTYQPETQSKAGVEATAFHEAYPGHHLQISIAKERNAGHAVQRYFGSSGFSEGWALYTERLADEMGIYGGDIDRLGLLSNEALRAARLVVDSGMHALGWSREQAVEYLKAHTAESPALVEAEIDRYIAVPGQATAYMLGNLEMRRLRARAEEELGEAFDVREFHDRVLEDGAVTLSMLEKKIERWLAARAASG